MRMPAKLLAHVAVEAEEMEEVISLENAVMLNDPVVLLRYERPENRCCDVRVIVRTQGVADVVKEGADYVLLGSSGLMSSGRGLKAVLKAINRKAAVVSAEQAEMRDDAVRKPACETPEFVADQAPVRAVPSVIA